MYKQYFDLSHHLENSISPCKVLGPFAVRFSHPNLCLYLALIFSACSSHSSSCTTAYYPSGRLPILSSKIRESTRWSSYKSAAMSYTDWKSFNPISSISSCSRGGFCMYRYPTSASSAFDCLIDRANPRRSFAMRSGWPSAQRTTLCSSLVSTILSRRTRSE